MKKNHVLSNLEMNNTIFFKNLFLERGEGRERNISVWLVASCTSPTGDLACNPGMCPNWELNP